MLPLTKLVRSVGGGLGEKMVQTVTWVSSLPKVFAILSIRASMSNAVNVRPLKRMYDGSEIRGFRSFNRFNTVMRDIKWTARL